jgi:hypothetical protein
LQIWFYLKAYLASAVQFINLILRLAVRMVSFTLKIFNDFISKTVGEREIIMVNVSRSNNFNDWIQPGVDFS